MCACARAGHREGRHKRGEHVGGVFAHGDVGSVVRTHYTVQSDTPSLTRLLLPAPTTTTSWATQSDVGRASCEWHVFVVLFF